MLCDLKPKIIATEQEGKHLDMRLNLAYLPNGNLIITRWGTDLKVSDKHGTSVGHPLADECGCYIHSVSVSVATDGHKVAVLQEVQVEAGAVKQDSELKYHNELLGNARGRRWKI